VENILPPFTPSQACLQRDVNGGRRWIPNGKTKF
jgi:hypothetical protein